MLEEFKIEMNKLHPTIKFTINCNFETKSVEFLDMKVWIENGKLMTDLYRKPTDKIQYLLPTSCHPSHVTKNIPYSLALRLKRICCTDELFRNRFHELKKMLLTRNYRNQSIEAAFEKVKTMSRSEALKKVEKPPNDRPVFSVLYNPKLPSISRIVRKHWNVMTTMDSNMKEIFPEPPMVAYKQPPNLGKQLIRTKLPQKQRKSSRIREQKGFFKCSKSNCRTCIYAEPTNEITSSNSKEVKVRIKQKIDCETSNVLYRIRCKKCNMEYVGETGRSVRDRISEHLGYIRNNKDHPTGIHFNSRGHELKHFSWTAFEKFSNPNPYYRKAMERFRINQFNVIQPHGMNKE